MILAVLADGDKADAYVSVSLYAGCIPINITYCDVQYVYTSERTAGGWRVYQKRG